MPERYVRRFAAKPVGSGAYTLVAATAGSQVEPKANPLWWHGRPGDRHYAAPWARHRLVPMRPAWGTGDRSIFGAEQPGPRPCSNVCCCPANA
ncbi:hypothetical protein [Actinoallomurus acaciae]|uniref:Uncharacterized protein n=1 Tax=Actinoallomurus acaciae TaxID=502577 RepID=A0ABV5YSE7_9ACTN